MNRKFPLFHISACLLWMLFLASGQLAWAQEEGGAPGIDDYVVIDEEPFPQNLQEVLAKIEYPEQAMEQGIEGTVIARVLITESGDYMYHEIIQEADPYLSAAVDPYVSNLVFNPALKDGKAIKYWVNVPFVFEISEDPQQENPKKEIDPRLKQMCINFGSLAVSLLLSVVLTFLLTRL